MARPGKSINQSKQKNGIAPEFKQQVKEFMKERRDVLKKLAKK